MTYKSVIDRIFDACNRHYMISDWGYGQLSDIKVLDEGGSANADYPYAFLNPAGVTRNQSSLTYQFNLIIMEMAISPQEIVRIQSDAIQYLNDLISDLRFDEDFDGDVALTNSISVFRERFQDEVAGATASFSITVANPIDNCNAPIRPEELIWVGATGPDQLTPGTGDFLELDIYTVNDESSAVAYWFDDNRIVVGDTGYNGRVELTYNMRLLPGGTFIGLPFIIKSGQPANTVIGWPTEYDTTTHKVTQIWDNLVLPTRPQGYYIALPNQIGPEYPIEITNIELKMYYD
jgi:hypothetical protein